MKNKLIFICLAFLQYFQYTFADVLQAPQITRPQAPSKFGARSIDWTSDRMGGVGYSISIDTPALKDLSIGLNLSFNPAQSEAEAGAFWTFNLQKVALDIKRGDTKYLTPESCQLSTADNLFLNSNRMIPIGNGVWVSHLSSARNVLRCHGSGFKYTTSNGDVYYFGQDFHSKVSAKDGKAIEWYLDKRASLKSAQIIHYEYNKEIFPASAFSFSKEFEFYSKPLIAKIYADDISLQISYETNPFQNPSFYGGIPQIIASRLKEIYVYKNSKRYKMYFFEYENSISSQYSRLSSVQEFGTDNSIAFPKTILSYRGAEGDIKESFKDVKVSYEYKLPSLKTGKVKFADFLGNGRTQAIWRGPSNKFWLSEIDPNSVFREDGSEGRMHIDRNKSIFLPQSLVSAVNIEDISFLDFTGNGMMDILISKGEKDNNPRIMLNHGNFNDDGEITLEHHAAFKTKDINFMGPCGRNPREWKTLDLTGNGKSDFLCISDVHVYILLNKGLEPVADNDRKFEIVTEQISFLKDSVLKPAKTKDIAVVDWNSDGLPDILVNKGNIIYLLLNNGRLAEGARDGNYFERIELGVYPSLNTVKASEMTIGDFTGVGLPSIALKQKKFLINNGLGKPLQRVYIENSPYIDAANSTVVQFTGSGKQQILSVNRDKNFVFELASRSFPNLLHSVVAADGRFLSFNYSSSILENNETIQYEKDTEIKNMEQNHFFMPVVIPLLKQVGISDGINPTRMTRYSYRAPYFDRGQKKFLGYSVTRKQSIGDESQAGTLHEQRFFAGYRTYDAENLMPKVDLRLHSEISAYSAGAPKECYSILMQESQNRWCTDLSGTSYMAKSGAAADNLSFATGEFNLNENSQARQSQFDYVFLTDNHLDSIGKINKNSKNLAHIIEVSEQTSIEGNKFLTNNKIKNSITKTYDDFGRVTFVTKHNEPVLSNDNLITAYSYFCPKNNLENPFLFCDNIETTTVYSSLGSMKAISTKLVYDSERGLPIEEWKSNQDGVLAIQVTAKYDDFARIVNLNKATGEKMYFEWNNNNANLLSVSNQSNIKTNAFYDDLGRVYKVTNSHGSASSYEYDPLGRLTKIYKNYAGQKPFYVTKAAQGSFDKFFSWLKNIFSLSGFSDDNSDDLIEFEKYEYAFPYLNVANGQSIESEINNWNQFDTILPSLPNAESFQIHSLGHFKNATVVPGSVSIYRRNNENESLNLVEKFWLSGADEILFSASRIDTNKFSLANKSSINVLGKVYKDYLNSEMQESDVLQNKLPSHDSFLIKNIYTFYYNGAVATQEFDTGVVQKFLMGVDYDEAISPEGRRTRNIYNSLGQIWEKQIGLDSNGNESDNTLKTFMTYDALGRLVQVTNNDGLSAWQSFSSNSYVDTQVNNALGVSRYFYDDFGRLLQSAICPVGTAPSDCNMLSNSILYKSYEYSDIGKVIKEEHTRFERSVGTHSKEIIEYKYGSYENKNRHQDIGLPIEISVTSHTELGATQSVKKLSYNRDGVAQSQELELFLGIQSLGVYQLEKLTDLAGNLINLRSRGGFTRETTNSLKENSFTGYAVNYRHGTSLVENVNFIQNGNNLSVPLKNYEFDSQGFTKRIQLENNLELHACWHKRKEIPLAFWAGDGHFAPQNLCDENSAEGKGLVHNRWSYDNDLFPIKAQDLSSYDNSNPVLNGNSRFSYDSQGRLASSEGIGDSSWGKINYSYSVGGKILSIVRSGNFIKERVNKNANSISDTFAYSSSGQIGVLQSVSSSDGIETALLNFTSDVLGFRTSGASPTLSVFSKDNSESTDLSWKNGTEIPMQMYAWNGRGQLAGTFSAVQAKDSNKVTSNELLNYRFNDEYGNPLAELDGVTLQNLKAENNLNQLSAIKLPRNVFLSGGVVFERDELHINLELGSFASLKLITRSPALNATSPGTLDILDIQTRKELTIKDPVGSVSYVIDLDTKKIVERNTAEPFGLARGIPLLSNSILSQHAASGKRTEASLYSNSQSNRRENWEIKPYEVLVKTVSFEMQGMRGSTVFATGKFSSQTGLNHMGVRTLDSARGVWLSPDLYFGQNLEAIVSSVIEGNLFQYALNNPISNLDPTGMKNYVEKDAGKGFDSDKSWKEPLSSIMGNSSNVKIPMAPSNQSSSSSNNSRDTDQSIDSSNNTGGGNSGSSSSPPEFVKPTWSVIPLTKETCGSMIAAAAVRAVMGVAVSTAAVELAVPSGSASLLVGAPIAREMFAEAAAMGILGLGCFEYISMRGDGSGKESESNFTGGKKIPNSELNSFPVKKGKPPIGSDGKPVELHHRNQNPKGPIDEMTRTDHRLGENYKLNHPDVKNGKTLINRNEFSKFRREYWNREWNSGRWLNDK